LLCGQRKADQFSAIGGWFPGDLSNISQPETTKAKQATAKKPGKKAKAK
jgi:hypothetical protein